MKYEASFNTEFNHWLKNVWKKTGAFELKYTKTDSLPFRSVQPHQLAALIAVRKQTFVFKIPDAGWQNPFDCFCLRKEPAYVVIKYPEFFCLIHTSIFAWEKDHSKRKSLTSERARQIAEIIVENRKKPKTGIIKM